MSSDEGAGRIKSAASLLVKGGTLTSEACPKCGGVQVRFADKTTCINCGNQTGAIAVKPDAESKKAPTPAPTLTQTPAQIPTELASVASIVEEKISALVMEIRSESDISSQKQKADLLESYLRILEKARSLLG